MAAAAIKRRGRTRPAAASRGLRTNVRSRPSVLRWACRDGMMPASSSVVPGDVEESDGRTSTVARPPSRDLGEVSRFERPHAHFTVPFARSPAEWIMGRRAAGSRADRATIDRHVLELEQDAQRHRAMLLSMGDAVIATGVDGIVTQMNPVAASLTGW